MGAGVSLVPSGGEADIREFASLFIKIDVDEVVALMKENKQAMNKLEKIVDMLGFCKKDKNKHENVTLPPIIDAFCTLAGEDEVKAAVTDEMFISAEKAINEMNVKIATEKSREEAINDILEM